MVNLGMDKWEDGLMYSALLCTKTVNVNSPTRRRPIVFAESPAIESVYNVRKLFEPIYQDLTLLKDNSGVLIIGNECANLKCRMDKKIELDHWWRSNTKTCLSYHPKSMMEAEQHKRNSNWNLVNYDVDKLYVLSSNEND